MISIYKKYKTAILIGLIVLGLLAIAYSLKTPVFRLVINKKIEQFHQARGLDIKYKKATTKGISIFELNGVSVSNNDSTITSSIALISVEIPFKKIIKFRIEPTYIRLDSLTIDIQTPAIPRSITDAKKAVSKEIFSNNTARENKPIINKAKTINLNFLFTALAGIEAVKTTHIDFNNLTLNYTSETESLSISVEKLSSIKGNFFTQLEVKENYLSESYFNVSGKSDKNANALKIRLYNSEKTKVHIPIIEPTHGYILKFDTLSSILSINTLLRDSIHFINKTNIHGLEVFHPKLSRESVNLDFAELNINTKINTNQILLDTLTYATLNKLSIPIRLSYCSNDSTTVNLRIKKNSINATSAFESLPKEHFSTIQDIDVSGKLNFELYASINLDNPENLVFNSKLTPEYFKINKLSPIDFTMLNDTFTHIIYHKDSIFKSIPLNDGYKYFCRLEDISKHLINAVIISEDGSFYSHKGFDPDGFRYAMARNIKEERLARGGSTITMQLVKNLFLNKHKNLIRKAEEAIIVWLIETQNLVSKERLLEIYLNIIDWGPNINGIAEASEFYFKKNPDDIELNEAIFLASIIPRPSKFKYSFDSLGYLRPYMEDYYEFVGGTMLERNMITESEFDKLIPNVTLKGDAKYFLEATYNNRLLGD